MEIVNLFWFGFSIILVGLVSCITRQKNDYGSRLFRIEAKLDAILKHLEINVEFTGIDRAKELASQGRKIDAIKQLRADNPQMGLKEAKEMVDSF